MKIHLARDEYANQGMWCRRDWPTESGYPPRFVTTTRKFLEFEASRRCAMCGMRRDLAEAKRLGRKAL